MKIKEIIREKKNLSSGISLIVLVITIIVIIILAAVVILTLNKDNPIEEANKARYESDVANMQALFTNTVAKVMAVNQSSVKIKAGELNETKSGESSVVGEAEYTIENSVNSSNTGGKIIFDSKENTQTEYYTGKKLPIYSADNTTWYADEEGTISLKIGEKTYGTGTQNSEGTGTTTPPSESGTGSGISQEAYNSLVSRMDKMEETINAQSITIQTQNTIIQGQGDRIYKLENETILNKREVLLDKAKEVQCPGTGNNRINVDISLDESKSVEGYKYLEIQTDIYSPNYGNHIEKTNIIALDSLTYWDDNTVNWSNGNTFNIGSMVTEMASYLDAVAWLKNENTLHIGHIYTDRGDFTKLRIKKIYGIK